MEVHPTLLLPIQGKSIILISGEDDRTVQRLMKGQLTENSQNQGQEVAPDLLINLNPIETVRESAVHRG